MKMLLVILSLLGSSAFASDFACKSQVSAERMEGAVLQTWPLFNIGTYFQECSHPSDGQVGECMSGSLNQIVTDFSVCYHPMDVKNDCIVQEQGTFQDGYTLRLTCKGDVIFNAVMPSTHEIIMTCNEGLDLKKTWRYDSCSEVN